MELVKLKVPGMYSDIIGNYSVTIANKDHNSIYGGEIGLTLLCLICSEQDVFYNVQQFENIWEKQVPQLSSTTFNDGIIGYGWLLAWLSNNNYIHVDTNEILEEFDDIIYKSYIYSDSSNLSLQNGIVGKAIYLYQRYFELVKNSHDNYFKILGIKECLIDITNSILENLKKDDYLTNTEFDASKIIDIYNILTVLNSTKSNCVNLKVEEQITHALIGYAELIFEKKSNNFKQNDLSALLLLANIYFRTGKTANLPSWTAKGKFWCDQILMKCCQTPQNISQYITELLTLKTLDFSSKENNLKERFEFVNNYVKKWVLNKLEEGWNEDQTGTLQFAILTLHFVQNGNEKKLEEYIYSVITLNNNLTE